MSTRLQDIAARGKAVMGGKHGAPVHVILAEGADPYGELVASFEDPADANEYLRLVKSAAQTIGK